MKEGYPINTGYIFQRLKNDWRKYDRTFLETIVEEAFFVTLMRNKTVTVSYDGNNAEYLENYRTVRMERAEKNAKNPDNFPFPDYFLKPGEGTIYLSIVNYDLPCMIERESYYFNLFFALYLSLTDIINETDEFLKFHLENTFENDFEIYRDYLQKLCINYKEFLQDKYEPAVKRFFELKAPLVEPLKEGNKEFTTARQVLAVTYLLDELKVDRNNTSLTEIAKFIQFLTGKEAGVTKINDTTIYKRVKKPLSKTDKATESDLQFIRIYFEKLGLQGIVKRINKEIGSKE